MANLKEVRDRIQSVKNTQQITKAMKMVSAAKLRRAQQAITRLRPYAEKQNSMLKNILANLGGEANISFGKERELKNACIVVVTSNRGLCGAFNSNVIKAANALINGKYADLKNSGNLKILCIGKKGFDFYKKRFPADAILDEYVTLFDDLSFDNVSQVAKYLMQSFEDGVYDSIDVAYGKFKNAATQFMISEQYLPVVQNSLADDSEEQQSGKYSANYIFEPNMESLLNQLVPSILQSSFQKYVLDTHASEHGARMTAMDKASENAEELLKELKLSYNKARQEAITKEILEIVGGAAALEGG